MVKQENKEYLRSTLFGIEDSLVSTTGLIAGLSVGSNDKRVVLLAGLVAIVVEAVSMGASEYVSTDAMEEMDKIKRHSEKPALISGTLMMLSYMAAGLVPLLPIMLVDPKYALTVSVTGALMGLFILGYIKGKLVKISPWSSAIKILFIGGLACAIGVVAGRIFKV